ncbi:CLUMA_CG002687, isoform A [Clunio marinus]|uniref:CLUMA_CG002687, isoform A n=1 Tax=Clunio marinus TaxID=568069 RepID=A0A1J1HM22_9DIPT|nr:CLUMA_CG002687, isoform A [Clunio marinus]
MTGKIKATGVLDENDILPSEGKLENELKNETQHKYVIVWRNIILMSLLHVLAVHGLILCITRQLWFKVLTGITAGAHRLWCHRAYKAKLPLRILLMIFNTMAFQDCVIHWARDHRVHHKYFDTNADPHNSTRGFFFSHVGWLLTRKHPEVHAAGKKLDISDLESDPVLRFQRDYYGYLMPFFCFALPTIMPAFLFGETFKNAFLAVCLRYVFGLHVTWSINSLGHSVGYKPYDKYNSGVQNLLIAIFAAGEGKKLFRNGLLNLFNFIGWHNYHHAFPWDYKTSELGDYRFNISTMFLDFMAWIGWAYDLRQPTKEMIIKRIERTGDGTITNSWGFAEKYQREKSK